MSPAPAETIIGRTNARESRRVFGIADSDRQYHLYLLGRSGTGKSTLLETLALQDIWRGNGLCVIDPHGDLVRRLQAAVPPERQGDLVYFNPTDPGQRWTYNPLRRVSNRWIPLAASGLIDAFRKLWHRDWGTRMEHILRNSVYALLETKGASLEDVLRLFSDTAFRRTIISQIQNDQVRDFWENEFAKYNPRYMQEIIGPIQNKLGAFLADPRLREATAAGGDDIRLRAIMDNRRILLVNLSKGLFGDDSASLLGALLVSAIASSGLSRENLPPQSRNPFYVYIDEFQSFTTLSVATLVSELRKFGIALTLANQHLQQLEPDVRHAVLGNCGTLMSFRVGPEDAPALAREFAPVFSPADLVSLPNYSLYLKLMVGGAPSAPFSAEALSPQELRLLTRPYYTGSFS